MTHLRRRSRTTTALQTTGVVGIILGALLYIAIATVAALAPTALAVWALGHFAFGWW